MTTRRLKHIFHPDGRAFIVAFDHGLFSGPARGMEQPQAALEQIVAGGADAILTSYGIATRFAATLAPVGLILRLDGGGTLLNNSGPGAQLYTVEDALRLGADAVAISSFPGGDNEESSLKMLARTIARAHAWGVPVMGEMVPGGFNGGPEFRTAESIALAARVGVELGADWVKIPYTPDGFEHVTSACYAPAVILGGAKKGSERQMLEDISQALQEGARGVAIGRNIFQAKDPRAMTEAIAALVHENASVEDALAML